MRISDWSSDVCSSDRETEEDLLEQARMEAFAMGFDEGSRVTAEANDRRRSAPPPGRGAGTAGARAQRHAVHHAVRHGGAAGRADRGRGGDRHRTAAPAVRQRGRLHRGKRSEEHTSELPSLIGITSAVLILHKKNNVVLVSNNTNTI